MYTFLIFLGGFIVGFISLAMIRLHAEKNNAKRNNQLTQEHAEEDAMRVEWRRNKNFDENSKTLKTIRLSPSEDPQNIYYNNNEIFATFCIEDMIPFSEEELLSIKNMDSYMQMKDMDKLIESDKILPSTFELYFPQLLESGKVGIYSKVKGAFVDKIMREDRGSHLNTNPDLPQFYDYYLPDGTIFFTIMNFHVSRI
jgi:hypothetical protein